MHRRWLLALPVCLFLALVPAIGQDKDKDAAKDKDAVKDKDAKDKKDAKDAKDTKDAKDAKDKTDKDKTEPKEPTSYDLDWGFKENKTFYQKMTTTTDQSLTVSSNKVDQKQKQVFVFSWTPVKKNDDGSWVIKQKIEDVQMNIDIGNQQIKYDSTNPDAGGNNPLSEFFKELVGSEFTLTLSKDLKVTKIEGRDAFVQKLTRANPQMKPLLEQILSEKAMMEMAEPTFAAVPNAKKTKGQSWTKDSNLDMGPIGKYENSYKYTFDGPDDKEKKLLKIKVDTTLKYKEPGDAAGAAALPFRIKSADLKSTSATGTVLYDPEQKRIEKTTMDLKLKGELVIDIGGQPTKVELEQTQTSTVETSDKNPLKKA
jgi:hypothetical protein